MYVKRRDILRTDRRIVLRTSANKVPRIMLRSWFIWPLRASFFGEKVPIPQSGQKTGILIVDEMDQQTSNGILKRFLMWHPPLLKSITEIRGGMDATIEAFA